MSEPTNDDAEALEDIKASSTVTEFAPEAETHEAAHSEPQGAPSGPVQEITHDPREERLDERAAGAMGKGFKTAYQKATGDELDDDSAEVFQEWLSQALDLARRFNMGFWPRFGVLTAVTALILAPPLIELGKTFKGDEER
jgi:hypothetical protein